MQKEHILYRGLWVDNPSYRLVAAAGNKVVGDWGWFTLSPARLRNGLLSRICCELRTDWSQDPEKWEPSPDILIYYYRASGVWDDRNPLTFEVSFRDLVNSLFNSTCK